MNEACKHWHIVYRAAIVAVVMGTAELIGATVSMPTTTHIMLVNGNFKLKVPTKFTRNPGYLSNFLF